MSYTVYCYCNDECIETTDIYLPDRGYGFTATFRGTEVGNNEAFQVADIADTEGVEFTANPGNGFVFTEWYYRIGGYDAPLQTSTNNPFVYEGGQDIHIRAEGYSSSINSFSRKTINLETFEHGGVVDVEVDLQTLYMYSIKFTYSGFLRVTSSEINGDIDPRIYLSTTSGWTREGGFPTLSIAFDDDSGGDTNFSLSYSYIEANKQYYIWVRDFNGDSSGYFSMIIEPPEAAVEEVQPAHDLIAVRTDGGFKLSWEKYEPNYHFTVRMMNRTSYMDDAVITDIHGNSVDVVGLKYGVRYWAIIRTFDNATDEELTFAYFRDQYLYTAPAQPTAVAEMDDTGMITVNWELKDRTSNVTLVWINLYDGTNTNQIAGQTVYGQTSGTVTFSAEKNKKYYVRLRSMLEVYPEVSTDTEGVQQIECVDYEGNAYTCTVSVAPYIGVDIAKWDWEASNVSATVEQTKQAHTALVSNQKTEIFSHIVWNDMVDKAAQIIIALGSVWSADYLTYENTKMTEGDTTLTADRFNSLLHNIPVEYLSTNLVSKVQGENVYAEYFTIITDSLNNWIDAIGE